jgi:hypothetical protein
MAITLWGWGQVCQPAKVLEPEQNPAAILMQKQFGESRRWNTVTKYHRPRATGGHWAKGSSLEEDYSLCTRFRSLKNGQGLCTWRQEGAADSSGSSVSYHLSPTYWEIVVV